MTLATTEPDLEIGRAMALGLGFAKPGQNLPWQWRPFLCDFRAVAADHWSRHGQGTAC
jgi:hypothetical protein